MGELKKSEFMKVLTSLGEVGAQQVKQAGKLVLPGLCMLKTRVKPATKAGKREVFGKVMMVKAKPAKTIVKAYPVAAPEEEHLRWRRRARREGAGLVGAPRVRCPQALGSGPALRQDVPLYVVPSPTQCS